MSLKAMVGGRGTIPDSGGPPAFHPTGTMLESSNLSIVGCIDAMFQFFLSEVVEESFFITS
jgi:hypothetical protein